MKTEDIALQLKDLRVVRGYRLGFPHGYSVDLMSGPNCLDYYTADCGPPRCDSERVLLKELNRWRRELGMEELHRDKT